MLNSFEYTNKRGEHVEIKIISTVAARWKTLGSLLDFSVAALANIESSRQDVESFCHELLSRWLQGATKGPVTWEKLVEAINNARYGVLAQQLREGLSCEGRPLCNILFALTGH